jgi:urease accessory protein
MSFLHGQLSLTCACDEAGRSYLRQQSFSAPFHISKPYWDGHALIVQVANPTAGIFAGDSLTSEVVVEPGARLLLTTPSASRVHTMPEGHAECRQRYRVESGGWLEVMAELFIPQAGCRYRQRTQIELAADARMFFVETLAPGRTARGECFEFAEVDWETEIVLAGRLIVRERFRLWPDDASLTSLRQPYSNAYYAGCYLIGENWNAAGITAGGVWMGASRLMTGGWSIKMLAPDSMTLRAACRETRARLAEQAPALRANPRKL